MGRLDGNLDVPTDQSDPAKTIKLSGANLTLAPNYAIGRRNFEELGVGGSIRVSWPTVPAQSPPRDTDDAGK